MAPLWLLTFQILTEVSLFCLAKKDAVFTACPLNISCIHVLFWQNGIELKLSKHHIIVLWPSVTKTYWLYHQCFHFRSFLPPKENIEKYIIGNLSPCFFCHFITKKTQLVTGRYIVSTNTSSNQQGRLRIEPPTSSTCREDIRGRLGLTPRKLEQYLYH